MSMMLLQWWGHVIGDVYAMGGHPVSQFDRSILNHCYTLASNSWAAKASMLGGGRAGQSAFAIDQKVFIVGGDTADGFTDSNTNYEYASTGDAWTVKAVIPTSHVYAGGTSIGGYGYTVGGYDPDANYQYSNAGDSWASKTAITTDLYRANVATIGSDTFYTAGNAFNYEYSEGGNSWATKTALVGIATYSPPEVATIGDDKCYVVGGYEGGWLDNNDEYSQSGDSWAVMTVIPYPGGPTTGGITSGGLATLSIDQTLYTAGGNDSGYHTGVFAYSQSGNAWTSKTSGASRWDLSATGITS